MSEVMTPEKLASRISIEWVIGVVFIAGMGWFGLSAAQEDIADNTQKIESLQVAVSKIESNLTEISTTQEYIQRDVERIQIQNERVLEMLREALEESH